MVLLNTGITHYKTGDFKASETALERSHEIGVEGGWIHRQVYSNIALGHVRRIHRDFTAARRHLHSAYAQAQKLGFPREEALALEFLGDVYRDEGLIGDAMRFYARAAAIGRQIAPQGDIVMEVHRRMGECLLQQENPAGAATELELALRLARIQKDRYEEGVILRVRAAVGRMTGDSTRVRTDLERSVQILEEIGARYEQAVSLLDLVETGLQELERDGDRRRRTRMLDIIWDQATRALDLLLATDVTWWVERARETVRRVSQRRAALERSVGNTGEGGVCESSGAERPAPVIVHASRGMRDLLQLCDLFAGTREPVLIIGETGTGKELIARRIHEHSPRSDRRLVSVNVSAIPETLFEREFFGHVKGAFSGADRDGQGYAARADGGTLFLDEIGDLPLDVQPKLLRLLQEGTFRALGDPQERQADLRLIAATHADLGERVRAGTFRADLYYRLKILELDLPPVRERREDVLLLLRHFLAESAGRPVDLFDYFDRDSLLLLESYGWPGNVREVAMVARRAHVDRTARGEVRIELVERDGRHLELTGPGLLAAAAAAGEVTGMPPASEAVERSRILLALEETGGARAEAARRLGLSRSTLYRKMRRLGISTRR